MEKTACLNGLLKQTFEAAIQTAQTFPSLIDYLFEAKQLDYVLSVPC